jgi:cell division protein FtsW
MAQQPVRGQAVQKGKIRAYLLPNKGIPLPFVSYGRSSLVTSLACVGLLMGIEARTPSGQEPGTGADKDPARCKLP